LRDARNTLETGDALPDAGREDVGMKSLNNYDRFEFERALWQQNVARVAGVDEAGRGPLAGPVVAAAAILPSRWAETGLPVELAGLNDSKQLAETQRERFFHFITGCGEIEFGIAEADALVIDEINILQATHRAMNHALAKLNTLPPHALVDGRPVKTLRVPQTAIVKGDARSYSIAAASVLAKVTRDRLITLNFLNTVSPNTKVTARRNISPRSRNMARARFTEKPSHR
jgi:ribonuclease HII